ncbi:response regulator transcription factor [Virgibacillus halodenitrificans]|jgi:two-component system, OmpR family, response regulator ResD|uniref:DNA-binding response regulator n=1 Tax=Virgibacillus halodenitrificans TaxID=1482 RepID=A0AAC9NL82_VIRHA|nr:response regulator transcription factor [Virgibacillus halodenitrificans]APC48401.1 DNA-binding response regulator [Virgibacillus halodenitrificans]MBD1222646.1 response regulator transcription factor [Virgibacillus halodenitrificans]MCG1028269.1 response regulator transcription factor [Virgibacillus halodenitrificans]MCJ0930971.1 response regulator transcription factor [Virgibacillus halodenitrificans]MEC2160358.1 response regulator transcription factor [Virgibacillus halodenitrificans]
METSPKILVVDDEERIRRLIRMYLEREDFTVEEADNGTDALELSLNNDYDVILLDIMMPEMDGIEVCKELRKEKSTPVIMLTAKGEEANRVQGFEIGADDYIVKPFSPREVVLRIKAILKRVTTGAFNQTESTSTNIIVFPHITIDHDAHRVTADGAEVSLTPKEYELLCFLAKSPDKVFNREHLLKEVWQYEFFGDLRTVDTHVKRLREKLNNVSKDAAKMIVTVWGVGYKFEVDDV